MSQRPTRAVALAIVTLAVAVVLAACGGGGGKSKGSSTTGASGAKSGTVALLLPENKTARYESQDRPLFEKRFHTNE